jgi:hypothetical protein
MAQRRALAFLAAAALLILACCFLGGEIAAIAFAVLAMAYPFALMALGAMRKGRLGGPALPILLLLLLIELSLVFMLVFRGRVLDGPWVAGLPLAAAFQIYGIFLLPLAVSALGFAQTFRRFGVDEKDLARLRQLAPKGPE